MTLIATVGEIMHKAIWTRGAAVTWMKDTEAKAPGKMEGLFSFLVSYNQDQHHFVFQKTNK